MREETIAEKNVVKGTMKFFPFILLLLLTLRAPTLRAQEAVTVQHILNGDSFLLADGRTVRLAGIMAPAAEALERILANKPVILENQVPDRYGRIAADVYIADGARKIWLQEALVRAGTAFVYPPLGTEFGLEALLKAERAARKDRLGLWGQAAYADIPADKATSQIGHFAFIRGVVLNAARVKNRVYLNFGEDWKTDFTIEIAAHDLRAFKAADVDLLDLKGKMVRVRGLVQSMYGPMIEITHPSQLEILDKPR